MSVEAEVTAGARPNQAGTSPPETRALLVTPDVGF